MAAPESLVPGETINPASKVDCRAPHRKLIKSLISHSWPAISESGALNSESEILNPGSRELLHRHQLVVYVVEHTNDLLRQLPMLELPILSAFIRVDLRLKLLYHHQLSASVVDHLDADLPVFASLKRRALCAGQMIPDALFVLTLQRLL